METISFYSYKGGVGRSLILYNIATYLARFGQKVFVVDFDLEAPGLHYKLLNDNPEKIGEIQSGVLDCIYSFYCEDKPIASFVPHVKDVFQDDEHKGWIKLLPAGNPMSNSYEKNLAKIEWHRFFHEASKKTGGLFPEGIPFFLEFKQEIKERFNPDFLLIDTRTGITEIGGVAANILPDKVVCVFINNAENYDGVRKVMKSIVSASKGKPNKKIEIIPVLARIPAEDTTCFESETIEKALQRLNAPGEGIDGRTLSLNEIFVVHFELAVEKDETSRRVCTETNPSDSPLISDYLRLFPKIISKDKIQNCVNAVVKKLNISNEKLSEEDITRVIERYPHPEVLVSLIRMYLSEQKHEEALKAAFQLCRFASIDNENLVIEAAIPNASVFLKYLSDSSIKIPCPINFLAEAWKKLPEDARKERIAEYINHDKYNDLINLLHIRIIAHINNKSAVYDCIVEAIYLLEYVVAEKTHIEGQPHTSNKTARLNASNNKVNIIKELRKGIIELFVSYTNHIDREVEFCNLIRNCKLLNLNIDLKREVLTNKKVVNLFRWARIMRLFHENKCLRKLSKTHIFEGISRAIKGTQSDKHPISTPDLQARKTDIDTPK